MPIPISCPACAAVCQHDTCCECGAEVVPPFPKGRFCGCCGETWRECVCPPGPTEDYITVCYRARARTCEGKHEIVDDDEPLPHRCAMRTFSL